MKITTYSVLNKILRHHVKSIAYRMIYIIFIFIKTFSEFLYSVDRVDYAPFWKRPCPPGMLYYSLKVISQKIKWNQTMAAKCPPQHNKAQFSFNSSPIYKVVMSQRSSKYIYLNGTCWGRTFCLTRTDTLGSRQAACTNTRIWYIILSESTDMAHKKCLEFASVKERQLSTLNLSGPHFSLAGRHWASTYPAHRWAVCRSRCH